MAVDTTSLFSQVIQDHLDLKERNSELDNELPLDRYKNEDPFDNHPLFKTEEQARIEDKTMWKSQPPSKHTTASGLARATSTGAISFGRGKSVDFPRI
jgi:hypothetical protein